MKRCCIGVRVDGDAFQPHFIACFDEANCDFSSIGDEDLLKMGKLVIHIVISSICTRRDRFWKIVCPVIIDVYEKDVGTIREIAAKAGYPLDR